jgi:hypothetical protein
MQCSLLALCKRPDSCSSCSVVDELGVYPKLVASQHSRIARQQDSAAKAHRLETGLFSVEAHEKIPANVRWRSRRSI